MASPVIRTRSALLSVSMLMFAGISSQAEVAHRASIASPVLKNSSAGSSSSSLLRRAQQQGQEQPQSSLPPTAPTVNKPRPTMNAFPPLPDPLPPVAPKLSRAGQTGNQSARSQAATSTSVTAKTRQGASPANTTAGDQSSPATAALKNAESTDPASSVLTTPLRELVNPAPPLSAPGRLPIPGSVGTSSVPWSIVTLLTLITLIPSLLICVTPFARLLVVFHFLRQALGLQTTPSNQTLIGLTLILTFFIMQPVGKRIFDDAFVPLQNGQITPMQAASRSEGPLRDFMVHFVREKDAAMFLEMAHEPRPANVHDLSMRVLLPAYIVSELKAGFQIGAVLFLPFLVVDMVVASITTSVGMMQLPPVVISTPLKLLLFLMVDGWHLLIGALVRSFN